MWTGSPPCQPFSVAGKRKGTDDERHLWPVWFNLVRECKPSIIFGEQVAAAIRQGWLDSLQEDLEAENYACAAAVLPASGVGALHKRDRLWIVAHASGSGRQGWGGSECSEQREIRQDGALCSSDGRCGEMADTDANRRIESLQSISGELSKRTRSDGVNDLGLADSIGEGSQGRLSGGQDQKRPVECGYPGRGSTTNVSMADSNDIGHQWNERIGRETERRAEHAGNSGFWDGIQAVQCKDGKVRVIPIEPEIFPLADGISNRVGILRGAG
ncbi:MAG: DNA cytosine methyltransferase, partial [Pseudohongiellaceae bacterium]